MIINKWRLNRQLHREVDAWIADAQDRALVRDVGEALAGISLLIDAAEVEARRGVPGAGKRLEALVAPLERLAVALGGGAR